MAEWKRRLWGLVGMTPNLAPRRNVLADRKAKRAEQAVQRTSQRSPSSPTGPSPEMLRVARQIAQPGQTIAVLTSEDHPIGDVMVIPDSEVPDRRKLLWELKRKHRKRLQLHRDGDRPFAVLW